MCDVCGCGEPARPSSVEAVPHVGRHLHFGNNEAGVSAPGVGGARLLEVQRSLMDSNRRYAAKVREQLVARRCFAVNLLSSPGSGKTTLLSKTLETILPQQSCLVIEGDQQSSRDADILAATGAATIQINTGKGCHLDAHMVQHGLAQLPVETGSWVFIENVGNLVCPAGFDLGEHSKVVVLSVTEGDDKPLKYPDVFYHSQLLVISKLDLLPHVDFDVAACVDRAREINPELETMVVSAKTGEGMAGWYEWLQQQSMRVADTTE